MAIVQVNKVGKVSYNLATSDNKEKIIIDITTLRRIAKDHGVSINDIEIVVTDE